MKGSIILSCLLLVFGFCFLFGTVVLRQLFLYDISLGMYVGGVLIILGLLNSFFNKDALSISSIRLSSRLTLFIKLFFSMLLALIAILVIFFISKSLNHTDIETRVFLIIFIIVYAAATLIAIILLIKLKNIYYKNKLLFIKGKYEEEIMLNAISDIKMIYPGLFKIKLKNKREIIFIPSFLDSLLKMGFTSSKIEELKRDLKEVR